MPDTWLSRLRKRIKRHPVVTSSIAGLTSLGVILRWLRDIIDWVSRWDTWNLHSQRELHHISSAVAQLPPGTSEACYAIAIVIVIIAASRKTTEASPKGEADKPASSTLSAEERYWEEKRSREHAMRPSLYERLAAPKLDKARADTVFNEQRKAKAEADAAEEQLRQLEERRKRDEAEYLAKILDISEPKSKITMNTDPPPRSKVDPPPRPKANIYAIMALKWTIEVDSDSGVIRRVPAKDPFFLQDDRIAIIAPFRNDATPAVPSVSPAKEVMARVDFSNERRPVTGFWLRSDAPRFTFGVGELHELVLCIFDPPVTPTKSGYGRLVDDQRAHPDGRVDSDIQFHPPSPIGDYIATVYLTEEGRFLSKWQYLIKIDGAVVKVVLSTPTPSEKPS